VNAALLAAAAVNGVEAVALADRFRAAVPRPGRPADVEPHLPLGAPLEVIAVAGLRLADVLAHAAAEGLRLPTATPAGPDRLNGCLVAYRGQGLVFLDADLPADRRRWTAAHELGHWLAEYDRPRRRAVARLGVGIAAVLDGDRPATADERLSGALAGLRPGPYWHLLRREPDAPARAEAVRRAETAADRVARELLAPGAAVAAEAAAAGIDPADASAWAGLLTERFGLPTGPAADYAARLARAAAANRSFAAALGL
jgi:hypothetical protein